MVITNSDQPLGVDEIVVTGLSGRFPEADNIEEFAELLYNGIDLVTADDRRWQRGLHGLPERNGKVKNLEHFDATFFNVPSKQAHLMDPQLRKLLEVTYETIVDAGYHPSELRGSRTGVYVGVGSSESEKLWTANPEKVDGYAFIGCCLAMFSNRISYAFNFKGPSSTIDTACSSSLYAFAQAVNDIRSGQCDAAIVAGANLCLKPENSLIFHGLHMLSPDGRCAAFDESANGYVRSEAIVAVLLQKRSVARRVYCNVRGAISNNDGAKVQGITFPSLVMQRQLVQTTLEKSGVNPLDVVYVEAHGTGTMIGDPQEVNALTDSYCTNRKNPLLLGSVKSNMGHSETASGLCSIAKIVLALERCVIPANLHYKNPNKEISAICDGRIKVVDKNMPLEGNLVAVNSFGIGGANVHVILEAEEKQCRKSVEASLLPRLVIVSGRTAEAVHELLALAVTNRDDAGLLALMTAVHAHPTPLHHHRGYCLLTHPIQQEFFEVNDEPRPVWFVFSGMGAQWAGMGRSLMEIPAFASSVRRSAAALEQYSIDLEHLLFESTDMMFDDVINSFVSITTIQVALVDVLRALDIKPDGIIGFSIGEIGCAYADDTLSLEQAVLAAYWRGRSIAEANLPRGAMASVGLSWDECAARCPPDIVPACNNAADNVTISGPVESVEKFVTKLSDEGIFVRHVNSSGIAFHSKYIASAAPLLHANLERLIPKPKLRSSKWVPTSMPPHQWDSELARLSNAAYHVNNVLSPVYFEEALRVVPTNAVLVEVAPHAILQALLRRARPAPAVSVPLLRRDASDATLHLLAALGKLYGVGALPHIAALYPPVSWPVPRGTPAISPHIKWDHTTAWAVANFGGARFPGMTFEYDLSTPEASFIAGHNIDGRVLFPATGYIYLVWKTMANLLRQKFEEIAVVLENINFKRATIMPREGPVQFLVNVLEGTGEFEISEGSSVVATGRIRLAEDPDAERLPSIKPPAAESDLLPLLNDEIYRELRLQGYHYNGIFRGIHRVDAMCNISELLWSNNWIAFMDTMLQLKRLGLNTHVLKIPTNIQRIFIDPRAHLDALSSVRSMLPVHIDRNLDVIQSGGIEIRGIKLTEAPRATKNLIKPILEFSLFLPYDNTNVNPNAILSKHDAISINLQILLENVIAPQLKIMEVALGHASDTLLLPSILKSLETEPLARVEVAEIFEMQTSINTTDIESLGVRVTTRDLLSSPPAAEWHLVTGVNILSRPEVLHALRSAVMEGGMILLEESPGMLDNTSINGLNVVARQTTPNREYVLLRRVSQLPTASAIVVLDDKDYNWVEILRTALQDAEKVPMRVYAVSHSKDSGALGLAACLRAEPGGHALRCFQLSDAREHFDPTESKYASQVASDLAVNVLRAGVWGCYRHLPLTPVSTRQVEHAYVDTLTRGDLSSLRWIESELKYALEKPLPLNRKLCRVYFSALNFRDVMLATGKLPPDALPQNLKEQDCKLGLEFSGRTLQGQRVMGIVAAKGLATTVVADKDFLWNVPELWSLEQASTVPVAYATAYYALCVRGRMRRGESVLIHAGAGGVGQAAIAIALAAGCDVFTTVGTPEKREFLQKHFSALLPENIANSRDTSFEQLVLRRTRGRGVDLVLNSLSADKLLASVRCLAESGRFLEIGKLDLSQDTALGMSIFLKNTAFHGILLDDLFDASSENVEKKEVVRCLNEGIISGVVQPLPSTLYTEQQLEQAFRYMATGQHIGKVVLCIRKEEMKEELLVQAVPKVYMHPAKSYVIVGGLGGVGLELAQWLITRGASVIVLNSRSGVRTGYQSWCIRRWREKGVNVCVSTADAATAAGARALVREAAALAPVGGVFNLAAVLRDAFFENLTPDDFRAVARPKIDVTKALDEATRDRDIATTLEHFVVFSSVVSSRGHVGQSNYGFANSAMEQIVEKRKADGLRGLAIQWGAIGEVGLVAEKFGENAITISGTAPQSISSCMETLDKLLAAPHAVVTSMVVADKQLSAADPMQDVMHAVANILGIKDPTKASQSTSLVEMGMDSLMISEIKQTLDHRYSLVLSVQEIRKLTFSQLNSLSKK